MKVTIGITCSLENGAIVPGWPLTYINHDLAQAVEKAGALPVLLPVLERGQLFAHYLELVDGLIVSGEMLSIARNVVNNGGENDLINSNPLRYKSDRSAIRTAIEKNVPILGVCRGFQTIAVAAGGTLKKKDITIDNPVMHQQGGILPPEVGAHEITIHHGTILHRMLGRDHIRVNSFHRQAVDSIPANYRVCAVAPDGTIEAIESVDKFVLGVQFHPEMMKDDVWDQFFINFIRFVQSGAVD